MAPLYRNALFMMSSSVVGGASGFVFYFLIARSYSVNDLGYAQGLFNTISFLATLALLGLGPALVRFLPSAENKAATINTCLTLTGLVAVPLSHSSRRSPSSASGRPSCASCHPPRTRRRRSTPA
ncbi:MAG: hypothetical protein E6K01_07455 [Methanobacteriota archaeon]|nr:MAG: hypothetical protein E6K01_07455 [Euryarchaeota archaeon]